MKMLSNSVVNSHDKILFLNMNVDKGRDSSVYLYALVLLIYLFAKENIGLNKIYIGGIR